MVRTSAIKNYSQAMMLDPPLDPWDIIFYSLVGVKAAVKVGLIWACLLQLLKQASGFLFSDCEPLQRLYSLTTGRH